MTIQPTPTPCDRCGEAQAEWPSGDLSYCQDCWEYYTATAFWETLAEAEATAKALAPAQQMQRLVDLHHQQRKEANADNNTARATAIAPDCSPSDRPGLPLPDRPGLPLPDGPS